MWTHQQSGLPFAGRQGVEGGVAGGGKHLQQQIHERRRVDHPVQLQLRRFAGTSSLSVVTCRREPLPPPEDQWQILLLLLLLRLRLRLLLLLLLRLLLLLLRLLLLLLLPLLLLGSYRSILGFVELMSHSTIHIYIYMICICCLTIVI